MTRQEDMGIRFLFVGMVVVALFLVSCLVSIKENKEPAVMAPTKKTPVAFEEFWPDCGEVWAVKQANLEGEKVICFCSQSRQTCKEAREETGRSFPPGWEPGTFSWLIKGTCEPCR